MSTTTILNQIAGAQMGGSGALAQIANAQLGLAGPLAYGYVRARGDNILLQQAPGGSNNRVAFYILGEGEWDGIERLWINGKQVNTFDPGLVHFHGGQDGILPDGIFEGADLRKSVLEHLPRRAGGQVQVAGPVTRHVADQFAGTVLRVALVDGLQDERILVGLRQLARRILDAGANAALEIGKDVGHGFFLLGDDLDRFRPHRAAYEVGLKYPTTLNVNDGLAPAMA